MADPNDDKPENEWSPERDQDPIERLLAMLKKGMDDLTRDHRAALRGSHSELPPPQPAYAAVPMWQPDNERKIVVEKIANGFLLTEHLLGFRSEIVYAKDLLDVGAALAKAFAPPPGELAAGGDLAP